MNRHALLITFAATVGFALTALAGSVADVDGDSVPDDFDNCVDISNADQRDEDNDGFGTACDCDFVDPRPGDGFVLGNDIADHLSQFNTTPRPEHDITGDGFVLGNDIAFCLSRFNTPPG